VPQTSTATVSLVCRTNFTCTKCILHTLSFLQYVSAHHTCHHQGVSPRHDNNYKESWLWHMWCTERCCRIYNVWRIHL